MKFSLALFVVLAILSQRSAAQPDAEAFVRCPNECFSDIRAAFAECARFVGFGCSIIPCPDGRFRCDREDADIGPVSMPGEPITFNEASIFADIRFMVNFSVRPVQSDLYLLSDATGSIAGAIASVIEGFNEIVEEFSDGTNAAFGVGFYRDEGTPGTDNGFVNLQSITSDTEAATMAINSLRALAGDDRPEANLVALHRLATDDSIGWRPDSRRIVVYFGDAPGHEPTCDGGMTLTREIVIEELKAKDITVVAVSFSSDGLNAATTRFGSCSSDPAGPRSQADDIVRETGGGEVVPSMKQGEIVSGIMTAIRNIPRTFNLDSSDCDDFLTITSNPTLPVTVNVDGLTTVEQVLRLTNVCGRPDVDTDDFSCNLKYTETGADLPVTPLRFINIVGCV